MPKFFINFRAGNKMAKDVVGVYLPRLYQARIEALVSARELMAENVNGSQTPLETIIITDERGQELLTIPAEEVGGEHGPAFQEEGATGRGRAGHVWPNVTRSPTQRFAC